jgi:hypothetical protein
MREMGNPLLEMGNPLLEIERFIIMKGFPVICGDGIPSSQIRMTPQM